MGKEQGLGALLIEVNLNLIILRDLVPIDADDGAVSEDAVGDAVAGGEQTALLTDRYADRPPYGLTD